MRVVWLTEFGGPEVLVPGQAPDPEPAAGEVLIDVELANITFVETQFRRSGFGPFTVEPPVVPGNGVGGVISRVGAGVDPDLVGRRVVSSLRGSGGYAEQVVIDADAVIEVPEGLPLDAAVALLADGRTAMLLVRGAGLRPGERVLVEAAGGGVGSLLVQLACNAGAVVVAAAGGERKLDLARELGATHVVDYRKPDWTDRVRQAVGVVDVAFDAVGGEVGTAAFELVGKGGRMVTFGAASGAPTEIPEELAAARGVTVGWGIGAAPAELRELARDALAEAAAGRLRPVIGQRFPLERAADAHAAIESRVTIGKTLLEVR
ncbi:zinc-binding dehydrogenase [Saccharomonospora sp. NPDC046836]|uniref:zinc-binding dehydrogenase n=1 Tax=Saccharomonospora sp. NPDC046836 TaxID=3156921 RepID=UPI0033F38362